ncbi:MAG: oligosaccharide flippase family protein [Bacteroidia bacterium]
MAGSFLSNFSFTLILNLLIKLFWVFVIEISVQNSLGAEVYGVYFESFNFSYLFFILLDFGLSNYSNRTVAGDPNALRQLFPSIFNIKVVLTLVYLLVLFLSAVLMGYDTQYMKVILFIGLNHVLMSMMLFFRSNIGGLHLFKTDAVVSVMDRLLMGILCAAFLWMPDLKGGFNLDYFLFAQFVGYFGSLVFAWFVVARHGGKIRPAFDRRLFLEMLKKSYPFALLFFLMGLYTRIDSVMLGRMLPDGEFEVGIYASAFRILDAAIIFAVLLSGILLPLFSRMIAQSESVKELVIESFNVVLIVAMLLPLSCYFYADLIYPFLYDAHHEYGAEVFAILLINFIPMAMGYIFGTLLTAKSELRLLNYISVAGLVINVLLNLVFIPRWQAVGAVYATLITQSMVTCCTFYFSLTYFRIRLYDLLNIRVILYVMMNLASFSLIHAYGWSDLKGLMICVALGILWVFLFRIIRMEDLRKLVRSKSTTSLSH